MKKLDRELLARTVTDTVLGDVAQGKVGGAAALVLQQGEVVFEGFFFDSGSPFEVRRDTLFRMASMTKPVTAVAVMKLAERGLLNLDDPIGKYLPKLDKLPLGKVCDDRLTKLEESYRLTIRNLLTHSSGFGSGPVGDWIGKHRTQERMQNLETVVDYYADCALDFAPLTAQAYSGVVAFDVAARIVEVVSGMPYDCFLKQKIFDPLGMVDTTFAPTAEQWKRMIPMHDRVEEKSVVKPTKPGTIFEGFPTTYFAGGAGLASTLQDYIRFAEMLQNGGRLDGVQILTEDSVRQMATPQLPRAIAPGNEVWGLGVRVIARDAYGPLPVGTFGWRGAYGTHFWVDPVNKITAIYLKNSHYDGGSGAKTARQMEEDVHQSLL